MREKIIKNPYFISFLIFTAIYFSLWAHFYKGVIIGSDGVVYYSYFSKIFITHNFTNGEVIKFPFGTNFLQMPLLLIALFISMIFNLDLENGINVHFQRAVFLSALLYLILSMIMIYKMLKKQYSEKLSVFICALITFGTMIPFYTNEMASFSHIYGFFTSVLFVFYIDTYEQKEKISPLMDVVLGIILGLCTMIRYTNIAVGLFYLFYNVLSLSEFKDRLLKKILKPRIFVQIAGFSAVIMIQLILWRIQAGEWIQNTYRGETFDYITNPKFYEAWFSDSKGLFIYCPVLIFAILGMIFFGRKNKKYCLACLIVFLFISSITATWWSWWMGDCYGQRLFCDHLILFVFPMAAFFNELISYSKEKDSSSFAKAFIPIFCFTTAIIFVILNLTYIKAVRCGMLSYSLPFWSQLKSAVYFYLLS